LQIDAFLDGFHELVPAELISIFDASELELLISGLPEFDLDDLRANTDYGGFKSTDWIILSFWNVLRSFTKEEKALFLQFVTGTSKVIYQFFFFLLLFFLILKNFELIFILGSFGRIQSFAGIGWDQTFQHSSIVQY
jgi:hypothetical protein